MTWRIDAEGRPPQTRPSEAAALELQAELMAAGARYVVVWQMGSDRAHESYSAPQRDGSPTVALGATWKVLGRIGTIQGNQEAV